MQKLAARQPGLLCAFRRVVGMLGRCKHWLLLVGLKPSIHDSFADIMRATGASVLSPLETFASPLLIGLEKRFDTFLRMEGLGKRFIEKSRDGQKAVSAFAC